MYSCLELNTTKSIYSTAKCLVHVKYVTQNLRESSFRCKFSCEMNLLKPYPMGFLSSCVTLPFALEGVWSVYSTGISCVWSHP